MSELTKEEQILKMVKKVLTDVAKDTYTPAHLKHPLSENTIHSIRDCLALITAREQELAEEHGRDTSARPRFVDEAPKSVVVDISGLKKDKD
ncbi:MAG: segregation and condensation protein A [Gammaproteobacteria bacterium]|jgi:hypothetical protein